LLNFLLPVAKATGLIALHPATAVQLATVYFPKFSLFMLHSAQWGGAPDVLLPQSHLLFSRDFSAACTSDLSVARRWH
jgi:hypothetical protein